MNLPSLSAAFADKLGELMSRFEKAAEFGARLGKIAATGGNFASLHSDKGPHEKYALSGAVARGLARGADKYSSEPSGGESSSGGKVPPGFGLGLGLGGLSGALYGALRPRKDEYYELDEKGNIKLDKRGVPKTYLENRSRLMEALRRAATGALIGGGLGLAVDVASRNSPNSAQ